MISLKRLDAGEQAFIALGDLEQPPPGQAGSPLGVFFKLRREFSHGYFQPRVLARQAGLLLVALLDIKRPRGMRQKLITPLIIQGYWALAPVRG